MKREGEQRRNKPKRSSLKIDFVFVSYKKKAPGFSTTTPSFLLFSQLNPFTSMGRS